jgi:hypothetical protein
MQWIVWQRFVACSSTLPGTLDDIDYFNESFDPKEQVIVGLDTLASRHLLPSPSDFISENKPITPIDIHGIGGNIQARFGQCLIMILLSVWQAP